MNSVINIKILDYTNSVSLSGYTLSICPFTFIPITNIDVENILWDFGDGTTSSDLSATHSYQWPGNYSINLNIIDVNGNLYTNTFIPSLSVYDYIDNKLQVCSISTPVYDIGAGDVRDAIRILRYNSWQSYNTLSATGYSIYPYASGAFGDYLNTSEYYSNQWAQLTTYNKFLSQQTINNNTQYTTVSSYTTIDTLLYAYIRNNTLTLCNSCQNGSIFVGTSGYVDTYFSSDIPKNFSSLDQPIILFYSDNNIFSDPFTISTNYYNTITGNNLNYVNTKPAILPSVKIRNNTASSLSFSTNGIDTEGVSILSSFNIPVISWQNTQIPFVVKLKDKNGFSTKFYPLLSANNINQTCSLSTYCLNVGLFDNTNTLIPSVSFYTDYIANTDYTKGGYFKGYFVSPVTALNCYLSGHVDVQNAESYNIDTLGSFVYCPSISSICGNLFTTKYSYNSGLSSIFYDRQININTPQLNCIPPMYCTPISSQSQKQFGIWTIDEINNIVYCIDTAGNTVKTYYLSALSYAQTIIDFTANTIISDIPTKYAAAIDSDNNIWLTLFGSGNVIHINTITDTVDYALTPFAYNNPLSALAVCNIPQYSTTGYSSQQSVIAPISGQPYYKFTQSYSPFVPLSIDTDSQNNVWVSYILPLSTNTSLYYNSLIVKYSPTGFIIDQIPLPSFFVPRYLFVDSSDNVYITIDSYDVNNINLNTYIAYVSSDASILFNITTGLGYLNSYVISPCARVNDSIIENVLIPGVTYSVGIPSTISATVYIGTLINNYQGSFGQIFLPSQTLYFNNTSELQTIMAGNNDYSIYYSYNVISLPVTLIPVGYTSAYNIPALSSENICLGLYGSLWYQNYNNIVYKTQIVDDPQQGYTIYPVSNNWWPIAIPNISSYTIGSSAYNCFAGFTSDTYNRVNIINTVDNCIYKLDSTNPTIPSSFTFQDMDNQTIPIQGARGDWSGFRFISKYAHIQNSNNTISSCSNNFNIYSNTGYNYIAKINENIDMQQFYNSLRLQESLLDKDIFFNGFLGTIVGTLSSDYSSIGKNIYEKIANYVDNNSNVNTANINALISLCKQFSITYEPLNYNFPPNFEKVIDLLSINFNKLIGNQNKYTYNFDKKGSQYSTIYGLNLGDKICLSTDTFSLSEKVVAYEKYSNKYKLIQTAQLDGYTLSSVLPFSAFSQNWGWNLVLPQELSGSDIGYYYDFYRFVNIPDNTIYDSIINWDDIMTTVNYISTNYLTWISDDNIIDNIINYNLSKGLNLLST